MEGCVRYELHVRAVDADGNDLTGNGVLQKSDIYLFNEQGFVRMIPSEGFSEFSFGEDRGERLTLVAWGNLKEDTLITTEIAPGTSLKDAKLQLRQYTHGTHIPITDLFYCRREIGEISTRGVEGTDITLVMERMVAGLSIRTRYLAERYPYNGEAYRFIVHCVGTEMDFMGEASGDGAGYEPASVTDAKGDVYAPLFHIFPTGEGKTLEIDVYRKDEKLFTITKDNELRPLYVPVGQQTNIDIDFRYAEVKVFVSVVPWGMVGQDVEM
ncbi:FimB/Mfa2 family fimbrial subunit [Bacteroides cellulosilyticus]|jgi:hypothetical protein|uniref:FimB/Mfa2 family fimbrial subunit n=1 Tax=Bacteroides cellulosilyticus TaxID=246787 RepID=A0A6L3K1R7_9BACE|nr:FimB/Mfa2 family fimbrial subunit [Bacteroides cellulosilyticus]KAA5419140.1 FimB/Mfa2 family fimbrial subunit [Bacteroides cellulosilyticus]